ncbi:MAG TPA: hypothetical protein VEH06_12040 [Candidatus Bathyarchaeia archaeon]|nr:hypothetical protein [Candidatus Bathyarchaeia archaeon]
MVLYISLRNINLIAHVSPLRQKGENIRRQMEELIKVMLTQQERSQMRGQDHNLTSFDPFGQRTGLC